MRKILLMLTLLPAVALANPFGHGESPCGDFPHPRHHGFGGGQEQLPEFLNELNLSDTQQAEVKTLLKSLHSELEAKHQEAQKINLEIKNLSFSDDYTDDKAGAINEKANAFHKEADLKKARLDNAIYKLLTTEQKQKLKARLTQSEGGLF
jgi:Spy/CpxP family protein refolding chaperone